MIATLCLSGVLLVGTIAFVAAPATRTSARYADTVMIAVSLEGHDVVHGDASGSAGSALTSAAVSSVSTQPTDDRASDDTAAACATPTPAP